MKEVREASHRAGASQIGAAGFKMEMLKRDLVVWTVLHIANCARTVGGFQVQCEQLECLVGVEKESRRAVGRGNDASRG